MTRTEHDAEQMPDGDLNRSTAERILHFWRSAGSAQEAERRQRILLVADDTMATLPPHVAMDDSFFEDYRRSFVDAGATDADLDYFADYVARLIVEMTAGKPDDQARLLDAMVNHFALAEMEVHISGDDATVTKVLFPDRPRVQ